MGADMAFKLQAANRLNAATSKSLISALKNAFKKAGWKVTDKGKDEWLASNADLAPLKLSHIKKVAEPLGWEWDEQATGLVHNDNHSLTVYVNYPRIKGKLDKAAFKFEAGNE
jgi:hypothetical protein